MGLSIEQKKQVLRAFLTELYKEALKNCSDLKEFDEYISKELIKEENKDYKKYSEDAKIKPYYNEQLEKKKKRFS